MKKILLMLFLVVLLAGCQTAEKKPNVPRGIPEEIYRDYITRHLPPNGLEYIIWRIERDKLISLLEKP